MTLAGRELSRWSAVRGLAVALWMGNAAFAGQPDWSADGWFNGDQANALNTIDAATCAAATQPRLDPVDFFERLVSRYRGLHMYKDTVDLIQVTQREGEESSRVRTRINCEIADGRLRIQTPASQVKSNLGLNLPLKSSSPMRESQLRYDLWLAPHMAMKFTDKPLKNLRAGVDQGFVATGIESVTIDNKPMVHVELRSGCGEDSLSEDCAAKFDLYVNSDSMLIERIEGEQRLPDGASYSTTLQITPIDASESADESTDPTPAHVPTETRLSPTT